MIGRQHDRPRNGNGQNGKPPRIGVIATIACALALGADPAMAEAVTAVEYYNRALDHYFITAYPEEAAALDEGTNVKGWVRTGGEFTVWSDPAPDRSAVCRFFGTPGKGINSHFYTADAAECAKVRTQPAWTFEAIAFYVATPAAGTCAPGTNPVYRSYYTDNIADANHRFTVDLTAHSRMTRRGHVLEGLVMCAHNSAAEYDADVVRLLEQATLGPTEALVEEVKTKGIRAWVDQQLAMNVTRYTPVPFWEPPADTSLCINDDTPPVTPEKYCQVNRLGPTSIAREFYMQAKGAPDQLRMRMGHVWHQILVMGDPTLAYAHAEFQQRMRDNAFGTYENLLVRYAISPQLGHFQNWVGNRPEHDGIRPNENFARELMQLFTIGVNALNDDGTVQLDAQGQLIPVYGPADISTLARILTGFGFPAQPGKTVTSYPGPSSYIGDMVPWDEPQYHDQGAKLMLGGRISMAPGGGAMAEVRTAIKALIDHPNTPAFIGKQLIQKTVTSNPSPGYVGRVAAVFKNNGNGVRGDLAAVTRAVLLDPEARGARKIDPEYGRMREPFLLWTAMIRGLDVTTDGHQPYIQVAVTSGLNLFSPLTVFNYYPADFTLPFTDLPAPEFGVFATSEYLNRANQINDLLFNVDQSWATEWLPRPYVPNATGTPSPALGAFLPDASNPDVLVERINRLFLHGTMPAAMRKTIVNAVNRLPPGEDLRRVKLAINLTLTSINYQVQK